VYQHPRIIILYEDSNGAGEVRDYAPNRLLLSCIADRLSLPLADLARLIEPRPRKSNTKVLADLEHAEDITQGQCALVLVLDSDRIREPLGLPSGASPEEVIRGLQARSTDPLRTHPTLLDRNLESLIAAVGACDPSLARERLERALRKDRLARDMVLRAAASAANRHVRECVLRSVPSFGKLVRLVCELLPSYLARQTDSGQ
jgi:hypothetical protein